MRRLLKTLKWLLAGLALVLVLLLSAVAFVAGTKTGLRLAWDGAKGYLPAGVQVAEVRGRLIGPLTIRGLKVDNQSMHLSLDQLDLKWAVSALLKGQVHIQDLALSGLDYTALPSKPAPKSDEPFALPKAIHLPVSVQLDSFELEHAAVRTAPDAAPFVIDSARLQARVANQAWVIEKLTAHGPQFELDGGAQVTPSGRYSSQAKLDWTFRLPDIAPINGESRLRGDLDKLHVKQSVAAPYNAAADVTINNLLGQLALNAKVVLTKTDLAAIRKDLPKVILDSQISADGGLTDLAYKADVKAQEPEYGVAVLHTNGSYTGDTVKIDKLLLTSPGKPMRLSAKGQVALAQGNAMHLVLDWQKLQWPLDGVAQYSSPEGEFTLTGKPQAYTLNGGLRWFVAQTKQAGKLKLSGHGSTKSFSLETFALSGAPGSVKGTADVVWAPALKVDAELNGQGVNPGAIVPGWPGALNLQLVAHAEQQPRGLVAELKKLHIDGSLRKQPLSVDARGRYSPQASQIQQLSVVAGKTRLQAQGKIAKNLSLTWSLESSDLSTPLAPGLAGKIQGNGRVNGTLKKPLVVAKLDASGLRYDAYRLAQFDLDAHVDASGASQSRLSLNAKDGVLAGVALHSLALTGDGTPAKHNLNLDMDSDQGKVQVALVGSLPKALDRWSFTLNQARLAYGELAPWTLASPAQGRVSANKQSLEKACWMSDNAKLCLQGAKTAKVAQAKFSLDNLAFAYLAPFLPPDLQITGAVSGRGSVKAPTGAAPDVNVNINTTAGKITTRNAQGEAVKALAFAPGTVSAKLSDAGLKAQVNLPLVAGGGIKLDASVAGGSAPLMQRPLHGNIELAIENLDALPALVPAVERVDGKVEGKLALGGSLAVPQVNGRVSLKAPVLAVGGPGLEIKDIDLTVVGNGQQVGLDLKASSGGGDLTATGDIGLGDAGLTVDMTVKGDKFQVLDTRDARVFASPDLALALTPKRIDITGTLAVPRADITPHNLPASNGAVAVSEDQVIVRPDSNGDKVALGRELHARVRVIVGDPQTKLTALAERGRNYDDIVRRLPGDKVRFHGFGLKAIIAGDLLVTQNPGKEALGSGELRVVVGEYKAYGQDLSIQNGRVLFAGGPVSKPSLDVRAIRKPAEGILVGVKVRGQLQQPDFTLFSDPSDMTQSEQLSWLVLGRPLDNTSAEESSLVTKAALALGVKGGDYLARNIGQKVGLDSVGIETDAGDATQAALVVGKYLTPKLYVSYGMGIFKPISTLRLRYTLTPRWQLETQSNGTATGGDILYSIERGGK